MIQSLKSYFLPTADHLRQLCSEAGRYSLGYECRGRRQTFCLIKHAPEHKQAREPPTTIT